MPEEVRHDVLNALKHGSKAQHEFIRNRILTKTVPPQEQVQDNCFLCT